MIAVVQPHRYTRLQSLFEPFSTCFNDADAVIVAESMRPARRQSTGSIAIIWWRRSAPAAIVRSSRCRGRGALAGLVKGLAKPGDYVVCLGAGSITQWAYALPGELKALVRARWTISSGTLKSRLPQLRGRLLANEPLAPLTWFRVGGPAQALFSLTDESDLAYCARQPAARDSRDGDRHSART